MAPVHTCESGPAAAGRRGWSAALVAMTLTLVGVPGCAWVAKMGSDQRGVSVGKTFYIGGAGPFGHVGSFDVPEGLRAGGYRGAIEVFPWQSWIGWTIRDQIDRYRNDAQGRKLAAKIRAYLDAYPERPVNLVALSAGTGIATWALEHLPPPYRVNHAVFFSSSLSRNYDLSDALQRIRGKLYTFYSPADPILKYAVPIAGTVDRDAGAGSVGGLVGFAPPRSASPAVLRLYEEKVRNMPWRRMYSRYGYDGGHTDATSVDFVGRVVAPLLKRSAGPAGPPLPEPAPATPLPGPPATQPDTPPALPDEPRPDGEPLPPAPAEVAPLPPLPPDPDD